MEYVAQLPNTRKMLVPLVALLVGAAGAVGGYALIDDSDVGVQPTRVIVTDAPAPPSEGVAAKDEAKSAAAIGGVRPQTSSFGKDEAKTAASVGGVQPQTQSFGKDEAKSAAAIGWGIPSPAAAAAQQRAEQQQDEELQTDPHGMKWYFHK